MKSLLFLSWFESPYTFIAEFSCLNSYNVFTLAEVNILEHMRFMSSDCCLAILFPFT